MGFLLLIAFVYGIFCVILQSAKKIVMVSLSFSFSYGLIVGLVVLLFIASYFVMYRFRSPMRKWICFGLSAVSIAYLLYMMVWHDTIGSGPRLDWYLVGLVGIFASLALAGIGFMDLVKPVTLPVVVSVHDKSPVLPSHEETLSDANHAEDDIVESHEGDEHEKETPLEIATDCELKTEGTNDVESLQKEEVIGKVLPWFLDQLVQYDEEEQNAIKASAIEFVYEGTISSPSVEIARNTLYSQQRLLELCSAFILLDKDRSDCAEFAKIVFAATFNNTEISTLEKKIKGKDTMQITIDTYWEAQDITL